VARKPSNYFSGLGEEELAKLKQRLIALNLFIDNLYYDQQIAKDGIFPKEVLASVCRF